MVDSDGFRLNVGIILANQHGKLLWAKRIGQDAWQFPQGGIQQNESPVDALYRELAEEIGLTIRDVKVLGCTQDWLYYRLPKRFIRNHCKPLVIGQKQKWFLLRLLTNDARVDLASNSNAEFDDWRWVNYWDPLTGVVDFKREVYTQALQELAPLLADQIAELATA